MCKQASLFAHATPQVIIAVTTRIGQADHIAHGQATRAFGREGARAIEALVHIDHPPAPMRCDRDASAEVRHHKIHLMVRCSQHGRCLAGHGLDVQSMRFAAALYLGKARHASQRVQLIHRHRVHDKGRDAIQNRDLMGDQCTQVGDVLPCSSATQPLQHRLVDAVCAAGHRP